MIQRDIERFRKCHFCGGFNTKPTSVSDQEARMVFTGWCHDCQNHYGYSTWVDLVWDKEKRI